MTHIVGHQIDDKHVIHTYIYLQMYVHDNEFVCVGERESSRKIIFGGSVYTQTTLDYSYPFIIMLAFASFMI